MTTYPDGYSGRSTDDDALRYCWVTPVLGIACMTPVVLPFMVVAFGFMSPMPRVVNFYTILPIAQDATWFTLKWMTIATAAIGTGTAAVSQAIIRRRERRRRENPMGIEARLRTRAHTCTIALRQIARYDGKDPLSAALVKLENSLRLRTLGDDPSFVVDLETIVRTAQAAMSSAGEGHRAAVLARITQMISLMADQPSERSLLDDGDLEVMRRYVETKYGTPPEQIEDTSQVMLSEKIGR